MSAPRRRLMQFLVLLVCSPVSGVLGWVLLIASLAGNWWALAGWLFALTTVLSAGAILGLGLDDDAEEPSGNEVKPP